MEQEDGSEVLSSKLYAICNDGTMWEWSDADQWQMDDRGERMVQGDGDDEDE